jgi:hypothetical protein
MAIGVRILSNNLSGLTTNVTYYPESGGTIDLGEKVFPFDYLSSYYQGVYNCYVSTYDYNYSLTVVVPPPLDLSNPIITENDDYIIIGENEYLMFVDPSPSATPTQTPTNTVTPTPTPTNTVTPTPTPTNTETETPTPTPTNTETPTPTNTETPTPTPTNTETPTNTPTNTETPTNTPTITPTATRIYNTVFINETTTDSEISSIIDNSGPIILTNTTGTFPVTSGQTLSGDHGTTDAAPRALITGTSLTRYRVTLDGGTLGVGTAIPPFTLPISGGGPISSINRVVVTISNP